MVESLRNQIDANGMPDSFYFSTFSTIDHTKAEDISRTIFERNAGKKVITRLKF